MTEYISATPEPAKPAKARPSAVWFLVGGLLVVAGIVAGIVLFVRIFSSGFLSVEATIPPDGSAHVVTVDTDGDRFLWEPQYGSADCTSRTPTPAARSRSSRSTAPSRARSTPTRGRRWRRFDPGSGHLSVTCSPAEGPAQIGPALEVEAFVVKIIVAIVVPLLLVGLGHRRPDRGRASCSRAGHAVRPDNFRRSGPASQRT